MSDYQRRKEAVEKMAREIVKHSGGKISHEKAQSEAAKVARETDAQKGK